LVPSNNLNNIDDLAGMSAMEGINRLETLMTEINLTVCKIQQEYKFQEGPYASNS
jgi:hypothetical protein